MSQIHQSAVVGTSIFLVGVIATLACFQIPLDSDGSWGARVFPLISASVLVLLGTLEMYFIFRKKSKKSVEVLNQDAQQAVNLSPFMMLGLVILYLWMISKIGYLIATGIVAPAALALFGIRNPLGLLIAAIICPAAYHLIFFEALGVFPPSGEWFDLLNLIRD